MEKNSKDTKQQIIDLYESAKDVSLYKFENYGNEQWDEILVKASPEDILLYEVQKKLMRCKYRLRNNLELRKNDMFDIMNGVARYMQLKGWTDFSEFKD